MLLKTQLLHTLILKTECYWIPQQQYKLQWCSHKKSSLKIKNILSLWLLLHFVLSQKCNKLLCKAYLLGKKILFSYKCLFNFICLMLKLMFYYHSKKHFYYFEI